MAREQDLLVAFIEFADTMVDTYDVVDFLDRLAERCVELTNASDVGIMLADRDGTLQYAACSSERMRRVELFELQHEEGPGLDAFRGGIAVRSSLSDDAHARWPRVTPRAVELGFRSMSALPMRLRGQVIGALNIFSTGTAVLSGEDQMVAQALADVATIGILQARARNSTQTVTAQLETALESRIVIEQAKGVIAEHGGFDMDHAFAVLRAYARGHNRRLSQTAGDIVEGRLNVGHLAAPAVARPIPRV